MKEIKDYITNGPSNQEVDFMKNAVGQRDALAYETGIQKAAFIRRILDYNLPADYVAQQNKILKNMTAGQMKATAQKYLKPEKMNILLVADKQRVLDKVKKLGYEIVELDADGNPVSGKKVF
jgi:zinc protease